MKILVAGDFCPQDRVSRLISQNNFYEIFHDVKDIISDADYSIVNLECPIINQDSEPIEKDGPNLSCSTETADAIKYVGFNCVTLANNHFLDYGDKGVSETLSTLKRRDIDVVGGGRNFDEAQKILYKQIDSLNFAIINCCEHEFSVANKSVSGNFNNNQGGSNPLDPIAQYYSILEAKKKADKIVVIVHGGLEHYQLPTPRMKELYRFFIDLGADVVINHHQHSYSGYEEYSNGLIFYGLGNFCFDDKTTRYNKWNYGYFVTLDFNSDEISYKLYPYIQCNEEPQIKLLDNPDSVSFYNTLNNLNHIINDDKLLLKEYQRYMDTTSKGYLLALEPYNNRYFRAAYLRGLLPSFMKRKRLQLLNYISCESHIERLRYAIARMK